MPLEYPRGLRLVTWYVRKPARLLLRDEYIQLGHQIISDTHWTYGHS